MVFSKVREIQQPAPDADRAPVRPRILGILNVTPDSFSDGGRHASVDEAVRAAEQMLAAGADAIDIGGESTRPGSDAVSVDEEYGRVVPVLEAIATRAEARGEPLPLISIDTRRAVIARAACERGARIINDTAALRDDPELIDVVREHQTDVVLMHRRGTPRTMQDDPRYDHVVEEVREFFEERVAHCEAHGVDRARILLDPGLGFGKTVEHNYILTRNLADLRVPGTRLFLGASRKSFLGRHDDRPAADRIPGSLAFAAAAHRHRVEWVRVHDVHETRAFLDTLGDLDDPGVDGGGGR